MSFSLKVSLKLWDEHECWIIDTRWPPEFHTVLCAMHCHPPGPVFTALWRLRALLGGSGSASISHKHCCPFRPLKFHIQQKESGASPSTVAAASSVLVINQSNLWGSEKALKLTLHSGHRQRIISLVNNQQGFMAQFDNFPRRYLWRIWRLRNEFWMWSIFVLSFCSYEVKTFPSIRKTRHWGEGINTSTENYFRTGILQNCNGV